MVESINKEMQSSDQIISFKKWSKHIEPASIITIIVGFTFFAGWLYVDSYFGRLGVPHTSLEFSASFYAMEAFWPIVTILVLFLLLSIAAKYSAETIIKASAANFLLPILAALELYTMKTARDNITSYFLFIIAVILIIIWMYSSIKRISWPYEANSKGLLIKIFSIVFIFLFILFFISVWGDYEAVGMIEGTSSDVKIVNFSWIGSPPEDIKDKELVFIIYHEGNYYVVNKQKPAPEVTELYIIPDSQIRSAVMRNINWNKGPLEDISKP